MGSVSLCILASSSSEGFERVYAVKRMHPQLLDDIGFRDMFIREARLAGAIRHGNVVGVLDVQEDQAGPFLVMEYIEGLSLSAIIEDVRETMPLQVAMRILRDACRGLAAAHAAVDHHGVPLGIIHRDVSPGNVLVGFDGSARLADFGVAKAAQVSKKTAAGIFKGKLGYGAPEMLLFNDIDARADLFSFGVVAFETLSGTRLYAGEHGPRRLLHDPPPDLLDYRDVPDDLSNLIFRLLAKSPDDRPERASEVTELFDELLADQVARDGPLTIEAFMNERFARERKERARALSEGVQTVRSRLIEPAVEGPTLPREKRRPPLAFFALAAALVGAVAVGVLASRATDEPTVTPPMIATPAPTLEVASEVAVTQDEADAAVDAQEDAGPARRNRSKMHPSRTRVGGHETVPF